MSNRLNLPHAVRAHPTHSEQYIAQECGQLRDEIWTRVKDQHTTERYMLLACAVIYWFLSLHKSDSVGEEIQILFASAWYVPPVLAFLAAARWCENVRLIHQIADYTRTREGQILGPQGGWETYLKKANNGRGPSVLLSGYYISFWLFLVFSTMTIAAYQHALLDVETARCVADWVVGNICRFGRHWMPADHPIASEFSESVTITGVLCAWGQERKHDGDF
jgi:hypothetical protein